MERPVKFYSRPTLELKVAFADPLQNLQDWITQQWVIMRGSRIAPKHLPWLMGPIGEVSNSGFDFVDRLATRENLVVERNATTRGIVPSIETLCLSRDESARLSKDVIAFYENTADYRLEMSGKWNPVFRPWGVLVNRLFSKRLDQLNIPTKKAWSSESLTNEIISLEDPSTGSVKYSIWLRKFESTDNAIYVGIYDTCTLPCGKTCVKAVFPLPNGNATVIMSPSVGEMGELILDSSGEKFGDAGFYFLLRDTKGDMWAQFIKSFRDRLVVRPAAENIRAEQRLTLWHRTVFDIVYEIEKSGRI